MQQTHAAGEAHIRELDDVADTAREKLDMQGTFNTTIGRGTVVLWPAR